MTTLIRTTIPTITVRTTTDVQTAATLRYLDREGVDYATVPAEGVTVGVTHVDADGVEHRWSGFRPDQLKHAVADLTAAAA